MTENQKLLEAIKKYQSCPYVHELTCGNNSGHEVLKGIEIKGHVMLICPDCDYTQNLVPNIVWYADDMEEAIKRITTE